jgi:hypothetical protein
MSIEGHPQPQGGPAQPEMPSISEVAYPKPLKDLEAILVNRRRQLLGLGHVEDMATMPGDTVGVALSGGGIRSATFSLGVMQGLAKLGLCEKVDFLSTVSGGGYLGAFWGGWLSRNRPKADATGPSGVTFRACQTALGNSASPEISWLRQNGRYLTPAGAGDAWLAAAFYVRNLVSLHVVIWLLLLTVSTTIASIGGAIDQAYPGWSHAGLPQDGRGAPDGVPGQAVGSGSEATSHYGGRFCCGRTAGRPRDGDASETAPAAPGRPCGRFVLSVHYWIFLPALLAILASVGLGAAYWLPVINNNPVRRNAVTRVQAIAMQLVLGFLALAVFDTLGFSTAETLLRSDHSPWGLSGLSAAAVAGFAGLRKIVQALGKLGTKDLIGKYSGVLLMLAAAVLGLIWFSLSAAAGYGVVMLLSNQPTHVRVAAIVILAAAAFAAGRWIGFLNRSALGSLYTSRLIRSYLGATNPNRREKPDVTETIDGDDIDYSDYLPHENGGPLHLINVTVDETVDPKSAIIQEDRKGMGMAVGPCGISVGLRHHSLWKWTPEGRRLGQLEPVITSEHGFNLFSREASAETAIDVEYLSAGYWTGISGAAFTTGLGPRTSWSLGFLLGFFNVRLGWWWDSGMDPNNRRHQSERPGPRKLAYAASVVGPLYENLFSEFTAHFEGTARRFWYLSDGGHFENTGVYELIRRRVRFILVCDNGCDLPRTFEDFGGLVLKARNDFGVEIEVLSEKEIQSLVPEDIRSEVGTLAQLGPQADGKPARRALLARVIYPDKTPPSILLLLKPTVTGTEPADIVSYHSENADFPQETTLDQFFGEAQWEGYRKLGELTVTALLPTRAGARAQLGAESFIRVPSV